MLFKPFITLFQKRQLIPALRLKALYKPFYKLCFLAAAKQCGLLDTLAAEPMTFDELATIYCHDLKSREALSAWLQLGIRIGFLRIQDNKYYLKALARVMSFPENDATLALAQEVATLHHKLILETPIKLRNKELWELADQNGALTARSSLALEAFQTVAIENTFPKSSKIHLLEIGCGSGCYIRHAAEMNPSLHALGLELQPDVAEIARRNIHQWGLDNRVVIEVCDIRSKKPERKFDIVTLYNNIYYFPFEERVLLLTYLKEFIKHDGFLLITTCCKGGSPGIEALNLWGASTRGGGRLPTITEMSAQLAEAGYSGIKEMNLIPGDQFFAFQANIA